MCVNQLIQNKTIEPTNYFGRVPRCISITVFCVYLGSLKVRQAHVDCASGVSSTIVTSDILSLKTYSKVIMSLN